MDQWQGYSDAAGGSQRRYNNGTAQMTPGREFGQHQMAGHVHQQPQSSVPGMRYDQYGNLTQSSATSPLSTPQLRDNNGDVAMQDAHDAYGGSMKYPMRPHHQSHLSGGRPAHVNLHSPSEPSAAAQRYSPMEVLSPTSPYPPKSAGGVTTPGQQAQYASQRGSPTRADYPTSPYYNTRQNSQQLPPITPYAAGQQGPEGYLSSTVAHLDGTFANDPKSPTRRAVSQVPEKRPVPEFKKIRAVTDLRPRVNAQPPFRRANPEGGFISVRTPVITHIIDPANTFAIAAPSPNRTFAGNISYLQSQLQI